MSQDNLKCEHSAEFSREIMDWVRCGVRASHKIYVDDFAPRFRRIFPLCLEHSKEYRKSEEL